MRLHLLSTLRCEDGTTMVEVMIAGLLTGLIAAGAFQFYANTHDSTLGQQSFADAQLICHNTVDELKRSFRMAGYKVGAHDAYSISADSFVVYMEGSQPIDTIVYNLQEYTPDQYMVMPDLPQGVKVYHLYKQVNATAPTLFSQCVISLTAQALDPANIVLDVTTITSSSDAEWPYNNGYRTYSLTERVKVRNVM